MFNLGKGGNKGFIWRKYKKCILALLAVNSLALSFLILFPTSPHLGLQHSQSWIWSPWWLGSSWWVECARTLIWGFIHHPAPEKQLGLSLTFLTCSMNPPTKKGTGGRCELWCPFQTWLMLLSPCSPLHTTERWTSRNIPLTILKCTIQWCFMYLRFYATTSSL